MVDFAPVIKKSKFSCEKTWKLIFKWGNVVYKKSGDVLFLGKNMTLTFL